MHFANIADMKQISKVSIPIKGQGVAEEKALN
jgi:hypothetical protein